MLDFARQFLLQSAEEREAGAYFESRSVQERARDLFLSTCLFRPLFSLLVLGYLPPFSRFSSASSSLRSCFFPPCSDPHAVLGLLAQQLLTRFRRDLADKRSPSLAMEKAVLREFLKQEAVLILLATVRHISVQVRGGQQWRGSVTQRKLPEEY